MTPDFAQTAFKVKEGIQYKRHAQIPWKFFILILFVFV